MAPRLAAALCAALLASACADDPTQPRQEFMPEMIDSVAYDAFAPNPNTRDGKTLLAPAPGAVARGHAPFHYGPGPEEAARAGRELVAPEPGPADAAKGEREFQTFCIPCHGPAGQGDGPIIPRFPPPPPLTAEHARSLPDGQIFHIITRGQGLMPAHGGQVPPEARWRIIRYVRKLQGGGR